jgi:hypothetical protein
MYNLNEFYRAMYFKIEATKLAEHFLTLITFVNLFSFYFYRNSATKIIKYNTII